MRWYIFLVAFLCLRLGLSADQLPTDRTYQDLMHDLMVVRDIDCSLEDRLPVTYNHLTEAGLIAMPSARVGTVGSTTLGYTSAEPYTIWGARFQYFERLELVLNYRVFRGIPDPVLSAHGFGDFSDKGANWKVAFMLPEDTEFRLPGVAIGAQDFMGTAQFTAYYAVLTQILLDWDLELTLGFGLKRLSGLFGGLQWYPFRHQDAWWINGLSFVGEWDSTNYEDGRYEPHPEARSQRWPVNLGIKYRLFKYFDFSASYIRGEEFATSASLSYPLGTSEGLITKICETPLYQSPVNTQSLGCLRPAESFFHSVQYALKDQGFSVREAWLSRNEDREKVLFLRLTNETYRYEAHVRRRVSEVLAALVPASIREVVIAIDNEGLVVHRYVFRQEDLERYRTNQIGRYELKVLSPLRESVAPDRDCSLELFRESPNWVDWDIKPRSHTFWGSAKGKFKYSFGLALVLKGLLPGDLYYRVELGQPLVQNTDDLHDVDMLNPSQIINVRSDIIRYLKGHSPSLDQAFIQKNWFLGKGYFARVALGYFEEMYGGIAVEALYAPVDQPWAFGWESTVLMKRKPHSLGFTPEIRKLDGFQPDYMKYVPSTHFLNLYYNWWDAGLEFRGSVGRFMAGDVGARAEVQRVFNNGVAVSLWYTATTAKDYVNGQRYHDKGFSITIPLDMLYERSSRKKWHYGLSAWLRDVGVKSETGRSLYEIVSEERQY